MLIIDGSLLSPHSYKDELSLVVSNVGEWWGECVEVMGWLGEVEQTLTNQRPLAGSVTLLEDQKNTIQVCDHMLSVGVS